MSDRFKANLVNEVERIEVPLADLGAVVSAGRARLLRRRIAVTTVVAVVILGAVATSRLVDLDAFPSETAPADAPTHSGFQIPPEYADEVAALQEEQRVLTAALNRGDYEHVRELGQARLDQATDPEHWDYGNAIHEGHLTIGQAALRQGHVRGAVRHLLAAADTPGSPQLDSFGPNMSLARDLLLMGRREAVLTYLTRLEDTWVTGREDLRAWKSYVRQGAMPDFGANLVYGLEVAPIQQMFKCPGCRLPPARDRR